MTFNCKRIYISGFNLEEAIYKKYFDTLYSVLLNNLPQDWLKDNLNDSLCQVDQKQFVAKVKQDPKSNTLFMKDVGICLAAAGMLESAQLNQCAGIRAAVVHTQYIAKMCRQVLLDDKQSTTMLTYVQFQLTALARNFVPIWFCIT